MLSRGPVWCSLESVCFLAWRRGPIQPVSGPWVKCGGCAQYGLDTGPGAVWGPGLLRYCDWIRCSKETEHGGLVRFGDCAKSLLEIVLDAACRLGLSQSEDSAWFGHETLAVGPGDWFRSSLETLPGAAWKLGLVRLENWARCGQEIQLV
ncbi:hypothetical protein chiPu_0020792 [Chiloscyllium punctatum]|uniref:Uncharacterized protein n=1 Tax=Chiloscyllium punctatum TaxID=137246 RepID=A0A401RJS7_CHIPU|nr:hypothetical protein [Chiloscyllium punctatum]